MGRGLVQSYFNQYFFVFPSMELTLGHSHKLLVAFLAVAVPVCLLIVSKSSLLLSEVVAAC